MVERLPWDIRWERPGRASSSRCSMSSGGGRRNMGWLRRASAGDRGLLWWWRAFSEIFRCVEKEVNHRGHRGSQGTTEEGSDSLCFSVVKKGLVWTSRKLAF